MAGQARLMALDTAFGAFKALVNAQTDGVSLDSSRPALPYAAAKSALKSVGNGMPIEGLSLNLATVRRQWSLGEAVEACARFGFVGVAPWRDQVTGAGTGEAARIFKDNGVRVTGYCRGGLFPAADAAGRQAAVDDNKRMIDEAAAIGADCIIIIGGGLPKGSRDIAAARDMFFDGMAAILPHARAAKVPLAIEALHPMYAADRGCISTLCEALDLCDALGKGVGV